MPPGADPGRDGRLAGVLWLSAALVVPGVQAPPTFRSAVDIVRIEAVVLDRDGSPVAGLSVSDFEITEEGTPREIVSFEPVVVRPPAPRELPAGPPRLSEPIVATLEENRYLLVFFDDVHVHARNTETVRAHLRRFLTTETREGDWVTIVAPLAGLRFTARTPFERSRLPAVVATLQGQLVRPLLGAPNDWTAMQTVEHGSPADEAQKGGYGRHAQFTAPPRLLAAEAYAVAQRRICRSLAGLADAIESLAGFRGRKSVILYTEGFIRSPDLPDYDRVVDLARRSHVAIYSVDPRGLEFGTDPDTLDKLAAGSQYLALETGGRVTVSNDLAADVRRAALESSTYYLIGFLPAATRPGERKLKVRVLWDGLEVRAPNRYLAGGPPNAAKPASPAVSAVGRVEDSPAIPLRVASFFSGAVNKGRVATTLAIEVRRRVGDGERRIDLLIEARPAGPGLSIRDSAELKLGAGNGPAVATRELELTPGLWQARVVVRDPGTERVGSVLHTFEVPGATGLHLSSPLLSDALESEGSPRPRLRLDRGYPSGGALYCLYQVFGATPEPAGGRPRVSAGYEITTAGRTVQEAPPTRIEAAQDGQLLSLLGIGLAGFEPGDYTLTLRVLDEVSGEIRAASEPFTVVRAGG